MTWTLLKAIISAAVILAVAEASGRFPTLGAMLLTLPLVNIFAFIMTWTKECETTTITQLARETLVLSLPGVARKGPPRMFGRTSIRQPASRLA